MADDNGAKGRRKKSRNSWGSVYRRGDRWGVRVRLPGQRDWRRPVCRVACVCAADAPKCSCGKGRKLAEAKLADLRARWERERTLGVRETGAITFAALFESIRPVLASRLTPSGLVNAEGKVRVLAESPIGARPLSALTVADVETLIAWLRETRG